MHDPGANPPSDPGSPGSGSPGGGPPDDWPTRVVDAVEDVVDAVNERVVRPLLLVARAVVFGFIVATMALLISVLLAVAVIRLLDVYAFRGRVWASDALVGGLFSLGGLLAWSRRRAGTS